MPCVIEEEASRRAVSSQTCPVVVTTFYITIRMLSKVHTSLITTAPYKLLLLSTVFESGITPLCGQLFYGISGYYEERKSGDSDLICGQWVVEEVDVDVCLH